MDAHRKLVVILSTIIPVVSAIAIVSAFLYQRRRKRRFSLGTRGVTPIDDEEIESWKTEKIEERPSFKCSPNGSPNSKMSHKTTPSTGSVQKPPSVIVYQNNPFYPGGPRASEEMSPRSVKSMKRSMDLPETAAVLARAPNARPGLTDETVQGDEAFIPLVKRQPSRLNKQQPYTSRQPPQSRTARGSASVSSLRDQWYGQPIDYQQPARRSIDSPRSPSSHPFSYLPGTGSSRVYTTASSPPRSTFDDDMSPTGLSPRPLVRDADIGRAIG